MRVLDLGAHDGFVSAYIADKAAEHDLVLHIDGIELNEQAVAIFGRRMDERGVPGDCKVGRAEDAPDLFEPGTYDAVVAYELIEHVPDVDAFLDACERMVAPGGRIYLSTPNGTFGEGQNPHHLRVYRAVDLSELLRRRGDLQAVGVGSDTITVASYVPWHACRPPLEHDAGEVAIFAGPGWQQWSPMQITAPGGLGGSETAAARLAESLTVLGYTVTVYGEVEPGCYGQVVYRHHTTFDPQTPRDVVILSRTPWVASRPISAETVLLWMHDTDYGPNFTPGMASRIGKVMVLSEWHREHVAATYPFVKDKLVVTGNGINPDFFTVEPAPERNPRRVMYSSSPDRGLDLLLEWWPAVRERTPDAELWFCYADIYQAVAQQRPEVAAHHALVQRLQDQPGVTNLGALSQPDLALAMRSCGVWAAPSWTSWADQRFNETFCIGAVEAAAAGCLLVTSDWGALPERGGILVGADDGEKPSQEKWVRALTNAMVTAKRHSWAASPDALAQTWDLIAEDFVAQMDPDRQLQEA